MTTPVGCARANTSAVLAGSEPDNTREGVMVMDMGLHAIPTLVEPQQIIQILIPGVEERARHLPPLTSTSRLMPGHSTCCLFVIIITCMLALVDCSCTYLAGLSECA